MFLALDGTVAAALCEISFWGGSLVLFVRIITAYNVLLLGLSWCFGFAVALLVLPSKL